MLGAMRSSSRAWTAGIAVCFMNVLAFLRVGCRMGYQYVSRGLLSIAAMLCDMNTFRVAAVLQQSVGHE